MLSDDLLDPVQDGFDVTLRIAELESSSLIARKIMPVARMICASPDYLARHGTPKHPQDLREHASLTYGFLLTGNQWKLTGSDGDHWIQPAWSLCVNNAEVLRDVAIKGRGSRCCRSSSLRMPCGKASCERCWTIIPRRRWRSMRSIRRRGICR